VLHEFPRSSFRLRFTRQGDVLRAEVAGESSLENTIAYWQAIVSEVRKERPHGLLLVDELHGTPLGEAQWRQLVEAMRGRGMEGVRIAHVKPQGLQELEYCELHAREAGFEAHVFDQEYAAELWLRYGDRRGAERFVAGDSARSEPGDDADQAGCEVAFRREADWLVADVNGWIDGVDAIIDLFRRCATELRATPRGKLLVLDQTRGVVPPEPEMRRLLASLEGSGLGDVRIAWVDVRGTAVGRIETAEILGREQGYDVHVFDNEQRARIWLDYGES
jgi:hypothetical protein